MATAVGALGVRTSHPQLVEHCGREYCASSNAAAREVSADAKDKFWRRSIVLWGRAGVAVLAERAAEEDKLREAGYGFLPDEFDVSALMNYR